MNEQDRNVLEQELVDKVANTPIDTLDANDKQWAIEINLLEIEKLKQQVELMNAEKEKAEAQRLMYEQEILANESRTNAPVFHYGVTLDATCSYCGSEFHYKGDNADWLDHSYQRFCNIHDPCGQS
jgi:hypothetical protein